MPPPDKLGAWRVYECDWHDEPWRAIGDWQAARHLANCGHEPRLVGVQPRDVLFASKSSADHTGGSPGRRSQDTTAPTVRGLP